MLKSTSPGDTVSDENAMRGSKTILLVESDASLRYSRDLLLSTFSRHVQEAAGYEDVCRLSGAGGFRLVAISLSPDPQEAAQVAEYVRRLWPKARILLLGSLTTHVDDPLYDEVVDARFDPDGMLEACQRLLGDAEEYSGGER